MAVANVLNVTPVPGVLVADPTDLTDPFPYGGTSLGLVRDRRFRPNIKGIDIIAEEFGGTAIDSVFTAETAVFAAVIREYDPDMLAAIFPQTTSYSGTRTGILHEPGGSDSGTIRAGSLHGARGIKLLFVPKDKDDHPMILLYNALPMPDQAAALSLTVKEDIGMGVVFRAALDTSGRAWAQDYKDKISL